MDFSFRQLSLSAIISFCLSVADVNPEKDVSVKLFPPMSVLVCSTNMVGVSNYTNHITHDFL